MTIEFRCSNCNKLLRTPEGTAGKQAKCPECGSLMPIPAKSAFTPPEREPDFRLGRPEPLRDPPRQNAPEMPGRKIPQRQHEASANPFQPPLTDSGVSDTLPPIAPTLIGFSEIFSEAWGIFNTQWLMCLVGVYLAFIACTVVSFAVLVVVTPLVVSSNEVLRAVGHLAALLSSVVIGAFFTVGTLKYLLRIARQGEANLGLLFSSGSLTLPAVALYALLSVGSMVGMTLLILPGIVFGLYFFMAPLMLVDRRMTVIESFRYSSQVMKGNKVTVLMAMGITYLAGLTLTVLTCTLGIFLFIPFLWLIYVVIYLRATGQSTIVRTAVPSTERALHSPGY